MNQNKLCIFRTVRENYNTEHKNVKSNDKFKKLQEKTSIEKICKDEIIKNGK